MPRALKVFRTTVGFRDAYVAVASKAAALRAWGTEKDLFARGAAEEVTDPELMRDALGTPGEVVYRTRGGLEEQVAALGKLPSRKKKSAPPRARATKAQAAAAKPLRPRPSRAALDAAEAAMAALRSEQDQAEAELVKRERALAAERKAMAQRFTKDSDALQRKLDDARAAYQAALKEWEP